MKILGLLFLALFNTANAAELVFKFDVASSGTDIYACNAGLIHESTNAQVCYIEGTQTACNPGACTDASCVQNCRCTSDQGGAYLMDFMNAKVTPWGLTTYSTVTKNASNDSNYASIFTNVNSWNNRIDSLSFNLGSELYGAKYFVDVCFRGSQIEYYELNQWTNWAMFAQATATDINATNNGISYKNLSGLKVKAVFSCDLQGDGQYSLARNSSGQYDTTLNESEIGSGDIGYASSESYLNANAVNLFNTFIVSNSTHSPRFCKVRYYFTESNTSNIRKWQRHGANVCTFTKIWEGTVN